MASASPTFDPTSPFVTFATSTTRGIIVVLLRGVGINYHVTMNEAIRMYFTNTHFLEKIGQFKVLLSQYLRDCCDEYLSIHQQILDNKLQKSDLDENNMDHYVYCSIEKIMSENDGYKHLNCIFDGIMKFSTFQFKHLFVLMLQNDASFGSSSRSDNGDFNQAELTLLRYILDNKLNQVNVEAQRLYVNGDEYKNVRLKCEENNSCALNIENEKQRLEQQVQTIQQESETCECRCGKDGH